MSDSSMSDSKQKSSYEHGSDFERLRSYLYIYIGCEIQTGLLVKTDTVGCCSL